MNIRKFIIRETLYLTAGQAVCIAAMCGIFALLGAFDYTVVLGGALGGVIAVGNFFLMAVMSHSAADSAVAQDVKRGKSIVKLSYSFRLVIIGVLLFLLAKSGHCNLIALVCPLFFTFPVITVVEFFRKSGEAKS